ncbi:MAG: hypothetical protein JXA71_07390, partial [Chitinispirillaceae bacterium]|nr:hypothetical protein [Chitinispirillaceae bacterium]
FFKDKQEWRLRVSLEGKNVRDRENLIGVSKTSSDGHDAADLYEPPRMQGAGHLFFPHPEWKKTSSEFACDIRKKMEPVTLFQVGIAPWQGNDTAYVRIEGHASPASMYLCFKDASGVHEYKGEKGIALPPAKETRYLTLFVTTDRARMTALPVTFACGNPYPNPCRNGNRVRYTLPYVWQSNGLLSAEEHTVKIMIYDLAGRKIRDLVHRKQAVGSYAIAWDGKMNTGRIVSTGSYLFVLQSGTFFAKRKITVLR